MGGRGPKSIASVDAIASNLPFGVQLGDALIGLLDLFRDLLHFTDQRVGALFFFFPPRDFVAGFVACSFAPFVRGDQFAPLPVQGAKGVQIEGRTARFRHFGEDVEVITEVIQVMHGHKRIP